MASTIKQEKASKRYYHSNPSYRKKKIKDTMKKHRENREEYNKNARDYYKENQGYREYKIRYARQYRKSHKKSS